VADENGERRADDPVAAVRRLAKILAKRHDEVDRDALAADAEFEDAVALLVADDVPPRALKKLLRASNPFVAAAALAAIPQRAERPSSWEQAAIARFNSARTGETAFVLDVLADAAGAPVLRDALGEADREWLASPATEAFDRFLAARIAAGESLDPGSLAEGRNPGEEILLALASGGDVARQHLLPVVREWRATSVDEEFFRGLGTVVSVDDLREATLVGARDAAIEAVVAALSASPPRSILLVGETGVGKSRVVEEAFRRLAGERWRLFRATAAEIHAGQAYVGMLEERVQDIVRRMDGRRVAWVVPAFEEILWTGQYRQNPRGLLDMLMPHLEARRLVIVGEIDPHAYELVLQQRPKVARVADTVRLLPPAEPESLAVARDWLAQHEVEVDDETLREALDLASHYLPGTSAPGNLLRLLELTLVRGHRLGDASVTPETVLETLSEATGLPLHVLDPRTPLSLAEVREHFAARVLGQPEAVECLVERIALVKAGLTDPSRPLGVFLFVGPTGTGKTEIAKTLASFLFGSPDRLVRLDLSEFQTYSSIERLLTDSAVERQAAPLISEVRKQPFSVVLLDEFEKAHSSVWDLFLQVFDDGRLTDLSGRTVDFRHCVIVLTSNVGSAIPRGPGVGFGPGRAGFDAAGVERAVADEFRPELLNRLDRIVVFRPLDREVMRTLVEHELRSVLGRRGFRIRPWAVEWDDAAIDFLLEQGFSAELGARPLKRAVERHLLAPLATTIVERQFPEGDQFLFISARDGRGIDVRFVDPDADGAPAPEPGAAPATTVQALVLSPHGAAAGAVLHAALERLRERLAPLLAEKEDALAATRKPGFWESEERHATLARIELLDRLGAASETAERLGRRLAGRVEAAPDVVALLARRLHVLEGALDAEEAREPHDALLALHAQAVAGDGRVAAAAFARELAAMYERWAGARGMSLARLGGAGDGEAVLAVSGLGAQRLLAGEHGLHVLELHEENRSFGRVAVQVAVVRVEPGAAPDAAAALALARAAQTVVRRYRREPSPLVRDARGWRTGRLDRVLAGDFDVLGAEAAV
jgi:ATP-dependent Clp protease ATP-binding subunit ClpC